MKLLVQCLENSEYYTNVIFFPFFVGLRDCHVIFGEGRISKSTLSSRWGVLFSPLLITQTPGYLKGKEDKVWGKSCWRAKLFLRKSGRKKKDDGCERGEKEWVWYLRKELTGESQELGPDKSLGETAGECPRMVRQLIPPQTTCSGTSHVLWPGTIQALLSLFFGLKVSIA